MKKIAIFCSNPVNGGTAKVFADVVNSLMSYLPPDDFIIVPCVNINNEVEIYQSITSLKRIEAYSEVEVCGEIKEGLGKVQRLIRRVKRNYAYSEQKKKNIANMQTFLGSNEIDMIMIHNGGYVGDDLCNQVLEASYKANIPERIMVLHNDFQKSIFQKIRYWKYDKFLCKYSTKLATVSEFTKKRILDNSFIKKKISVLYNGIPGTLSLTESEKKQRIKYKKEMYNIGMIGNFMKHKGQIYLLRAVKKLCETSQIEFTLTIIGNVYEVAYYEECLEYIAKNNLQDVVTICQGIYNAGEYTNLFKFIVVPSLQDESFGLISLEAMKNSVPVIAFACGGVPEVIIDGRDGLLVGIGETDALTEAMGKLLSDTKLCLDLGVQAQKDYDEKFTIIAMLKRYIKFMEIDIQGENN